jgi:AraC-like DNA-binding protein
MADHRQPALFHRHRPGPPLDAFVEHLWYWEGAEPDHAKERLLPECAGSIVINLAEDEIRNYTGDEDAQVERFPGAVVMGSHSRYSVIDAREQRAVIGVTFRPGGMWPFFDPAGDELHNAHVALGDVWGAAGSTLRERILSAPTPHARVQRLAAELLARAVRPLERRRDLAFALRRLTLAPHDQAIGALSAEMGLSAGRFARLFSLHVGMTPKRYARLKRFELVLRHLGGKPVEWSELAQLCGYYDQPHLIRDCKAISGFTPLELVSRYTPGSHHLPL